LKVYRILSILLCASLLLSGCASGKYAHGYKVGEQEFVAFDDLSDENALKMVVLIHNVPAETYEEGVAKNLALKEYTGLLKKRNSKYLKESGIFELTYDKINFNEWDDEDLLTIFEALERKSNKYKYTPVSSLTDKENAARIVHFTGMAILAKELKKRINTQRAWAFVSNALTVALGVALAFI
jgi:hypothetical protein